MLSRKEVYDLQNYQRSICLKCVEYENESCLRKCMYVLGEMRMDPCMYFRKKEDLLTVENDKMRCNRHKKYVGKVKPRNNCDICWRIFLEREK